ncbi:MAG: B12-binding domain-containing radical SAM protein, partial [Candidatus Thorarchaeota archaeon]
MVAIKIMFVEPPKEFWFVMGEYLPPPLGILNLAAYLREHDDTIEIEVVDCNAERMTWRGLSQRIASSQPDLVAPSALATCNTFVVIRTIGMAKDVDPNITTVVGGQHFTALARETLETYPELDIIVRGEGEQTLLEVVQCLKGNLPLSDVKGITFRHNERIIANPDRPFFDGLEDLPFPAYDLVEDYMKDYHFTMMAGRHTPFALVEASRGCPHNCNFCSQCVFWGGRWRSKSPKRIADEFEYCYDKFGTRFFWLTDDNFGLGKRTDELCDEIISKGFTDEIMWFMQARCDDVVNHQDVIPKLRKAGLTWILAGVESHSPETLASFNKRIDPSVSKEAIH